MHDHRYRLRLFLAGLMVLWLALSGRQAAQTPDMTIAPADPVIFVGQTQPFSANRPAVAAVSAGGEYTCVTLPDGSGQCTGRNQFGQHGNGEYADSAVLDPISGLTTAARVVAGDEFACALMRDGSVKCWGLGESGQRGDRSFTTFGFTPGDVTGLTGASQVAAGYGHACALIVDGSIKCWGENREGQLGNGATADPGVAEPVAVTGVTGALAIATGAYHTCAILSDRTVACWGRNDQGQLGDGTLTTSSTPVQVVTGFGPLGGAAALAAGGAHTCVVLVDGNVKCWGENGNGQLGDGSKLSKRHPIQVNGINGAVAVSAGWQHTCAVLTDGTAACWGSNAFGQLGDGTTTDAPTPVRVRGLSDVRAISAGWWQHSCAVGGDGAAQCWGLNQWGQLGDGTTNSSSTAAPMTGTGVTWTSSDTAVATIDAAGRATGIGHGVSTITGTDAFGATASTTLTVRQLVTLSVIRTGGGTGTVSSVPVGIDCGSDCSDSYDTGSSVTLTATAGTSSVFTGWTGCDAVSGATCTVTMSAARTVSANFDMRRFVLTVVKGGMAAGLGNVSSSPAGIDCGGDCYEPYTDNTTVTLTASPDLLFNGWTGCDVVAGRTCIVALRSDRSVTASFVRLPF
jgi:alpha-tubulin suppressor-like RCC1 family protein